MNFKYTYATALLAILSGCASTQPTVAETEIGKSDSSGDAQQLKVFYSESCPVTNATSESLLGGIALAVASEVAGKVVGNAVDALGNYLSKTQAISFKDSTRLEGFASSENGLLAHNSTEGCMIVLMAKDFQKELTEAEVNKLVPFKGKPADETINRRLYDATGVSGPMAFYMEATLHYNGDEGSGQSTFTFVPRAWHYPEFVTPQSWRYSSKRDVMLRVEYSVPGQAQPFGVLDLQWAGVRSGSITEDAVILKKLPWTPLPEGLVAAAAKINKNQKIPIYPTNVTAMFTETAQPHTLTKYIGEALKGHKEPIVTAAQDAISYAFSQQARATARLAAAGEIQKKYEAYVTSYDAAFAAQTAYTAASSGAEKQKALVAAKIAYLRLSSAEVAVRTVYSSAELGPFSALPALPVLPT